jgi:hemerythrin
MLGGSSSGKTLVSWVDDGIIHEDWDRKDEGDEEKGRNNGAAMTVRFVQGAFPASWPPELDTGVPVLDEQHHLLDRMLVSLYQTLQSGTPRDLAARFEQLQCLMEEHFATEEAVMETCAYPHLGPHRAEHEVQVERIRELLHRFTEPGAPPLYEMVRLAREWLMIHVRDVDQDYAEHLRQALGFKAFPTT